MRVRADVAQPVEHRLPKPRVAGSIPVVRLERKPRISGAFSFGPLLGQATGGAAASSSASSPHRREEARELNDESRGLDAIELYLESARRESNEPRTVDLYGSWARSAEKAQAEKLSAAFPV
jgi:hypothetical protein